MDYNLKNICREVLFCMENNNNSFKNSLSSLSPDEIECKSTLLHRRRSKAGYARAVLVVFFLGVFVFCAVNIAQRVMQDREEQNTYSGLTDSHSAVGQLNAAAMPDSLLSLYDSMNLSDNRYTGSTDTDYDNPSRYAKYRRALLALQANYPDVKAWIVVTGTNIDYPILQGSTNNTYLRTDYKGNHANGGSIFFDYRMAEKYSLNLNAVIYGHNMTNGTMFRAIRTWYESATRNSTAETMRIEVYTADSLYIYTPFSAYRSDGSDFTTTGFASYDSFVSFLDTISSRSVLGRKLPYDSDSKICTLVTCTNNSGNVKERYVLHGLLTQVYNFD